MSKLFDDIDFDLATCIDLKHICSNYPQHSKSQIVVELDKHPDVEKLYITSMSVLDADEYEFKGEDVLTVWVYLPAVPTDFDLQTLTGLWDQSIPQPAFVLR